MDSFWFGRRPAPLAHPPARPLKTDQLQYSLRLIPVSPALRPARQQVAHYHDPWAPP